MNEGFAVLLAGGAFLGLSIAAPLGPVNLEMIDRGLRHGFRAAFMVGLGSTVADLIYIGIAYAGADPLSHQGWARVVLFAGGALVLGYLGAGALRAAWVLPHLPAGGEDGAGEVAADGAAGTWRAGRGAFAAGFLITLMNPMTIAFWLGILAASLAARPRSSLWVETAYVASLVTGCMIWVVLLSFLLHHGRRLIRGPVIRLLSAAAGLVLIGFGVHFAIKAFGSS
jgi:threonine/homoserine/homoserine lactone efflux protein